MTLRAWSVAVRLACREHGEALVALLVMAPDRSSALANGIGAATAGSTCAVEVRHAVASEISAEQMAAAARLIEARPSLEQQFMENPPKGLA